MSAQAQLRSFGQFGEDVVDVSIGPTMFGVLMLFTLSLICLVVTSLSSTSVNSERDRGTLAVLQATMLRPHEIFLAKFASSMLVALADAAPRSNSRFVPDSLEAIRDSVRESRRPAGAQASVGPSGREPPALWPAGLSIELAIALAAGYFTVSRLRIPARKLAPGQRVA